jgi:beta-galactosidase
VKLENRYDFLNLNQFDLQWQLLKDSPNLKAKT